MAWDVPKSVFWRLKGHHFDELPAILEKRPLSTSSENFAAWSHRAFDLYDSVQHPNVFRVYPHRLFCDTSLPGRCITHDTQNLFYQDGDHLTPIGAQRVASAVYRAILEAKQSLHDP